MNLFALFLSIKAKLRLSCVLALAVLLSACAAEPTKEEYRERFLTQITSDGSKWFIYKVDPVRNLNHQIRRNVAEVAADGAIHAQRRSQPAEKPKGERRQGKAKSVERGRFNNMLNQYLTVKGYCRNGYIELDSEETDDSLYFWGECKETATAGDEQKWPNNRYFDKEKRS